jgi:hypothetical protein
LVEAADFGHTHAGELFLPAVECLLGDAELAADLKDGCTAFGLPQRVSNPLVGKL